MRGGVRGACVCEGVCVRVCVRVCVCVCVCAGVKSAIREWREKEYKNVSLLNDHTVRVCAVGDDCNHKIGGNVMEI